MASKVLNPIDIKDIFSTDESSLEIKCRDMPNVIDSANSILNSFLKSPTSLLIAEMQSGKSSVIGRLLQIFYEKKDVLEKYNLNVDYIFVIINIAQNRPKQQLVEKLQDIKKFHGINNVFHIFNLRKLEEHLNVLKDKKILLIFDEAHADIDNDSIIHNFLKKHNIFDNNCNNNILRLFVSATPFEHLFFTTIEKVIMKNSIGYYSVLEMFENNKVRQAFDFKDENNVRIYLDQIKNDILASKNTGYIIIRLPQTRKRDPDELHKAIKNKCVKWCNRQNIEYYSIDYDMHFKDNINDVLGEKPTNLCFIYVKNKLRASETIVKKYIISMHDTPKNTYAKTTAQGFLGRATGYNANKNIVIYCDYEKADQYVQSVETAQKILPKVNKNTFLNPDSQSKTTKKKRVDEEEDEKDEEDYDENDDDNQKDNKDENIKYTLCTDLNTFKKVPKVKNIGPVKFDSIKNIASVEEYYKTKLMPSVRELVDELLKDKIITFKNGLNIKK
jgi:hypothetical protein